ncbi:Hypothetical protein, putative [Bodo saltans]|uniref:Ubiquitin-like protease family profile domain-containing protein n=1 Tax=Bodo saltans TaxID=75058 RepID=A0A0S4KIH0_BODSA|nr:Hypothetical protein, putative [Bodo saltans]|eukprot:CUI14298.1 Hypothetical protein, putative [Bodo saltans]
MQILLPMYVASRWHWALVAVHVQNFELHYFDILPSNDHNEILDWFELTTESTPCKGQKKEWTRVIKARRTQTNGYDCGVIVLQNGLWATCGIDPPDFAQKDIPLLRIVVHMKNCSCKLYVRELTERSLRRTSTNPQYRVMCSVRVMCKNLSEPNRLPRHSIVITSILLN